VISDEALFEKLLAGDMRAFDALYERYERPLFGFLRARFDPTEAEDILHEAFITILRERRAHLRSGHSEIRSFRAWLFTVARNAGLNRARSQKRAAQIEIAAPSAPSAHEELERHERAVILQRAAARLPESLAEIFRLRGEGMSYEELAQILDVPIGTIKSRVHEMVKRLRDEVEHEMR